MTKAHEVSDVLHQDVFYPAHPPRSESEAYKKIHHKLVVEDDTPCFICKLRNSQLGDPVINKDGAVEIETHHKIIEWALTDAVDGDKLSEFMGKPIQDVTAWVDHNKENLMVLCDRHHRHREVGIHDVTYPIWLAQKFVRDGYELTPDKPPTGSNQ